MRSAKLLTATQLLDKDLTLQSNMYAYQSLTGGFLSIARLGPSELFRGFFASSLRDAPYAGIFIVLYEGIKRQSGELVFLQASLLSTLTWSFINQRPSCVQHQMHSPP
jgi:hypothetical protein